MGGINKKIEYTKLSNKKIFLNKNLLVQFKKLQIIFGIICFSNLHALEVQYNATSSQSSLDLGFTVNQIKSDLTSLSGYGINATYNYHFSENWGAHFTGAQVMSQADDGFSILYTGLKTGLHYSLLGKLFEPSYELKYKDSTIVQNTFNPSTNLILGLNLEQYILNLSNSVQPGTGLGVSLAYQFSKFGLQFKPEISYSLMRAQEQTLTNTGIVLNAMWSL